MDAPIFTFRLNSRFVNFRNKKKENEKLVMEDLVADEFDNLPIKPRGGKKLSPKNRAKSPNTTPVRSPKQENVNDSSPTTALLAKGVFELSYAHTNRFCVVQENIKPEVLEVQTELARSVH